jgi:hypothetical protein
MKKILLPSIGLLASLLTAQAQYFYPTNLVVVQQTTSPTTGSGITLVQLQTNGTQVNSASLPTTGSKSIILSTSTAEGFVTLSANSNYLVLGGYNALPGSSPSAATAAVAPRAAATVDAYNNYALPISNPNIYSTYSVRGAASDGLGNFWVSGSGGTGATTNNGEIGVVYVGTAANQPYNVSVTETGTGNERCLDIYNGFLYLSTGSGSGVYGRGIYMISNVAGTYPEVEGSTGNNTNVMQTGASGGMYAFQINAASTIAYVAEDSLGGIVKFTSTGPGALWTSNYTISVLTSGAGAAYTNAYGCAVDWSQSPPVIYATSSETSANRLVRIVDTGASATATLLATAPASTAWRGVRFGPQAYAYISVPPAAFTGNPGTTATFSVTALGSPAPAYQWYSNSVAVSGATSSSFSVPNINLSETGSQFYVVVSNAYGASTSAPVALTVQDPAIVTEPVGATNFPGTGSVSLCVTAASASSLTYQWLSNGVPISGAQSSCYTAPNSAGSNTTAYSVIVSNALGASITSSSTVVSFTPYLLYDNFNYPNGNLFGDLGSPWTDINGSNPELVISNQVQIAQTNATTDAQSLFSQTVDNTTVWASFTLNVSQLPSNAGGVYFANFEDTNFDFFGRVFLLTSNAPGLTPDIPNVAYPGTYRVGIANGQNDSTGAATTGPTAVVELDMAPGVNYQVVVFYQTRNYAQLAVNPSPAEYNQIVNQYTPNILTSGFATDHPTGYTNTLPMAAYGLRQRTAGGNMSMSDLEVSYDWNGAGSGFAAVTAGETPTTPVIGLMTPGITNYSGNPALLEVAASGMDLAYYWYQNGVLLSDGADGGAIAGSSTAALTINPLSSANAGTYTLVVSNKAGTASSNVIVSVNTTATAPSFTLPGSSEPAASATIAEGANVTLAATAVGTGPITYQWYFDSLSNPQGASTTATSLTLTGVATNQAGTYFVVATGGTSLTGTSSSEILNVTGPQTTNIHYLRSLINPATFAVSDTTDLFTVQGVVTVATNLTSGSTSSYYLQDSTGGINLFITGDSTFRPALGDVVVATGVLSTYDDNLEIDVTSGANFQVYAVVTNADGSPVTNALPTPQILPWGYVAANPGPTTTNIEGSLLTMTNVYFTGAGGVFSSGTTGYPITNASGQTFNVYVSAQDTNFDGQPIPAFASSVTGVLEQTSATAYYLIVTRYSDIVTNVATAPVTITNLAGSVSSNGANFTLTWTAVPNTASYSVWYSTNLAAPFADKLATGLTFTNTLGTYTDIIRTNSGNFYVISSP